MPGNLAAALIRGCVRKTNTSVYFVLVRPLDGPSFFSHRQWFLHLHAPVSAVHFGMLGNSNFSVAMLKFLDAAQLARSTKKLDAAAQANANKC
jgi:hypothetical protein